MDKIARSRALKREKVAPGTVLIEAQSAETALTILHSGLAEVLEERGDPGGSDGRSPGGRRVGLIKGESLCGVTDLREPGVARRTIRAITECVVSNVPVAPESLAERLYADPELNARVLHGLVQRVESAMYLFRNFTYLWHKLAVLADSIALACDPGTELSSAEDSDRLHSPLERYSAHLRGAATAAGIGLPSSWDPNVLIGRIQEELGLYERHDAITVESTCDLPQFLFIKRLLGKGDETVRALLVEDEPGTVYIYQFLSRSLEAMIERNVDLVDEIEQLLERLFAPGGWVTAVLDVEEESVQKRLFDYYLAKTCYLFQKDSMNLLGRRVTDEYAVYSSLARIRREGDPRSSSRVDDAGDDAAGSSADARAGEPVSTSTSQGDRLAKYRDLAGRLLEFSDLTQKEQLRFRELLDEFKGLSNRLDDDTGARRIRDELGTLYWRLYESCFLKIIDTDLKSFVPGIMLHFGLVDETLVSEDDLRALDAAYARSLYADDTIPVMTFPYFLEKVYRGEQNPSLTEMGETFAKRLQSQTKMTRKERAGAIVYEDTPEDRVRFELRNIASATSGLLFGSRRRAFPILCRDALAGDTARLFQEPDDIARRIDEVRSRDFTLFYRDVGLRHKYGTDIIRKEVVPNFVLYPVVGSRMMMWQELDGSSRHTAGRILLPVLFSERFEEAMLTILAQFRWELGKTIAGANWMDPVDGGLVGAYYDYINFFQKNPRLTPEAKERLKSLVKKTRSDRDRFTAEYTDWVRYEYEGKIRLNSAAREIFYRHCPFPKRIREEMARKPLYSELETKYQNRVRKDILKVESRTRRFERAGEPLPEELERHLEMLRS